MNALTRVLLAYSPTMHSKCFETGETVAIKKVVQDKRYKNRELQTMRFLDHPNVVYMVHCFFSTTEKDKLYLNPGLECVPETVHHVIKHYNKMSQCMPLIYVKLYTYQLSICFYCQLFSIWRHLFASNLVTNSRCIYYFVFGFHFFQSSIMLTDFQGAGLYLWKQWLEFVTGTSSHKIFW